MKKNIQIDSFEWYINNTLLGKNFLSVLKISESISEINSKKYAALKFDKCPLYFVGSGSSFSVAIFARDLFTFYTDMPCFVYTVYDFMNFAKPGATVFIITQSGSTPDVLSAIQLAKKMKCEIYAISSATVKNSKKNLYKFIGQDNVFDICCQTEDAFVNSASPLASCFIFLEILNRHSRIIENKIFNSKKIINDLFNNSFNKILLLDIINPINNQFVCLGSGLTSAAVNELNLKISEAILEDSEKSELKNFTHGRFLKTVVHHERKYFYIFFGQGKDVKLINFLKSKIKHPNIAIIRNSKIQALNSLQLFFDAIMLAVFLSYCKNKFSKDRKIFDPAIFKIPTATRDINVGFNLLKNKQRRLNNPRILI